MLLFALQVRRRQANKPFVSPSNAPPAQEPPSTVTPLRSTRVEPPSLPSSLKPASELAERTVPDQEASLLSRLEAASANFEDVSVKAAKMEHMLAGIPIVEQIHAPSNQFRTVSNIAENPVTSAPFAVASDSEENEENLVEPVAPTQHAKEDIRNICVVGEIVTLDNFSSSIIYKDLEILKYFSFFCRTVGFLLLTCEMLHGINLKISTAIVSTDFLCMYYV